MTNRDLLKEAIADAKAVKEVAITNAKAALEEAFTPHLKSMLEQRLTAMEEEDDYVTKETMHNTKPHGRKEVAEVSHDEEDIDLEELLRELEDEDAEESKEDLEDGADDLEDAEEEDEEDEELDFDNMTAEDLESFIGKVVDEMIAAGELEGGPESMEDEPGAEMDMGDITDEEPMQEPDEMMSEEAEDKKEMQDDMMNELKHFKKQKLNLEKDLAEAFNVINTLKSELNEINLLNSKLLYTNKIFKAKNLSEAQKVQILTAFDNAETVKETKLVYETLSSNLNKSSKKELVRENRSFASKTISGTSNKQPVMETSAMVERFQKLAGLK
tara:strand:+ start:10232 stop:11218 length:987 start_codon:yes stop_codon:yes gene_type:complete